MAVTIRVLKTLTKWSAKSAGVFTTLQKAVIIGKFLRVRLLLYCPITGVALNVTPLKCNLWYSAMAERKAAAWVACLEQTFQAIERERMQGLPILNPHLQVKAIGFKRWQANRLGILLTPWFMNIVLLPEQSDWQVGAKHLINLPSGQYEFIVGYEPELGCYLSCSLFSPVCEFENQAAAEATAEIALLHLLKQEAAPDTAETASPIALNPEPLTRRALLQGHFLRG